MRLRTLLTPALLLPLLLAAPSAHAERSTLCMQIEDLPAVSNHYVQKVLDRADQGIAYAQAAGTVPDPAALDKGSWARSIGEAWISLITSELPLTLEQQELPRVTACMHFDVLLLECKMDEVRDELHTQLSRGSVAGIMRLQSLLAFLNERVRQLRRGGLDPLYSDPDWGRRYDFDNPDNFWCCPADQPGNTCTVLTAESCGNYNGTSFVTLQECTERGCRAPDGADTADGVLCPYDADYAPPFQSGFGCDIETMQPRGDYPPLQAELEALNIINQQVRSFRDSGASLLAIQQAIDELFGNPTTTPEPPEERVHLNAFGCGWTNGYCTEDQAKRCRADADCGDAGFCEVPERVCEDNRALRCATDENCGDAGPCIDLEEGDELPDQRALRGPFSFKKDEIAILSDFLGARAAQEVSRTYRDDLKIPSEFGTDQVEQRQSREFNQRDPLSRWFRSDNRLEFQVWSRIQARKEALIFPEAVDSQLEIAESLKGLREAVSSLSRLASQRDGVRQFVGRYAYFLNRTCIYRPCSLMLERVIRIVTADECFPYTNGQYLSDTPDDPRSAKCERAAGIE